MVYDFYESIFCSNLTFKFKYDEFVLCGFFNNSYAAYHFKKLISFDRKTALTWSIKFSKNTLYTAYMCICARTLNDADHGNFTRF